MKSIIGNDYWSLLDTLGSGGQGTTYKVRRTAENYPEEFALKVLHSNNPQAIERFRRDAQAVNRISSTNVIKVVEDRTTENPPYYITEYCSGGNLESAKSEFEADRERALQIFEDICLGVAAAHQNGVIHRDLKPENILLRSPRGQAVVADFGICHLQDEVRLTRSSERVGPRDYMAPELERSGVLDVSPVSDVYSLGKLLHFLLSGGPVVYREEHRDIEFNLVTIHNDGRYEHVNLLLDKMIIRDSKRRIQNASDVLPQFHEVKRLLNGGFNLVGSNVPQPCNYCGKGEYKKVVQNPTTANETSARDFYSFTSLKPFTGDDWRILSCSYCGHIQWFRVENAEKKW